jgi:hypothetical protein
LAGDAGCVSPVSVVAAVMKVKTEAKAKNIEMRKLMAEREEL